MVAPTRHHNTSHTGNAAPAPNVDALTMWDDNGNGRIMCAEASAHGTGPARARITMTLTAELADEVEGPGSELG